jgi:hypothetical protein
MMELDKARVLAYFRLRNQTIVDLEPMLLLPYFSINKILLPFNDKIASLSATRISKLDRMEPLVYAIRKPGKLRPVYIIFHNLFVVVPSAFVAEVLNSVLLPSGTNSPGKTSTTLNN